jgi:pimeloyl-ACP methyl ester carboxylesterase
MLFEMLYRSRPSDKYFMLNYLKNLLGQTTIEEPYTKDEINVIWLHGANQTSLSFEYLRTKTRFKKEIMINYSSMTRFQDNLDMIVEQVQGKGPHFVIGHSMGGIYALHLTQYIRVVGGVSISTPFRGSSTADWAKYIVPSYPLFKDIGRNSDPIRQANDIQLDIPWTQIVSTTGSVPYHGGPNDGVVTLASMTHRTDMTIVEVPHTHYEVVCSNTVADIIKSCYTGNIAKI